MSNMLQDLYQEVILDHNKYPHKFCVLENYTHKADGFNPLCGDKLSVYLLKDDTNQIIANSFQGQGCAISQAAASILMKLIAHKNEQEIRDLCQQMQYVLTGKEIPSILVDNIPELLQVFSGVCQYPGRVKCASLAGYTLLAALDSSPEPVSTE